MSPVRLAAVLAALAVLGTVTAGQAAEPRNLLVNGDFGAGSVARPWNELQPGSSAVPGWRVLRRVDYVPSTYWEASRGTRSIDLDGSPGPGEIAQTFATVPGRRYHVAFDLAANVEGPPRVKRLEVRVGGVVRQLAFDGAGHSDRAMGYVREGFDFVAPARTATLDFASLSRQGNWNGAVIDNVSVTDDVAPPFTAALGTRVGPSPSAARPAPVRPRPSAVVLATTAPTAAATASARLAVVATSPASPASKPSASAAASRPTLGALAPKPIASKPPVPAVAPKPVASKPPVVALAPKPHAVALAGPVDLDGEWTGRYKGKTLRLIVRQQAGDTVASLIGAEPSLGLAKLEWDGALRRNRIVALEICQRTSAPKVDAFGLVVTVQSGDAFVLQRNNCLDEDVAFKRVR